MTRQRYSKKESLNRILLLLEGRAMSSDTPETIPPTSLSEDEALSDIAELLADSLPGETPQFPAGLVPAYGGIFTWTGTSSITGLPIDVYTKITGTFQNSMVSYNGVTPNPSNDRILINDTDGSVYLISWSITFFGSSAITYWVEAYNAAVGIPDGVAKVTPLASGSAVSISGESFEYVSGSAAQIDLRVRPNAASAWFKPEACHLMVQRIHKYPK